MIELTIWPPLILGALALAVTGLALWDVRRSDRELAELDARIAEALEAERAETR